jgi:hypothetical protein
MRLVILRARPGGSLLLYAQMESVAALIRVRGS